MSTVLKRGSRGIEVNELQAALNFHIRRPATPLNPDGIFGPKTEARLREFQAKAQIPADGIAGPQTFRHLYRAAIAPIDAVVARNEGGNVRRLGLATFPGLAQVSQASPDFVPKRFPAIPQPRAVSAPAFDFESKVFFTPLDKDQTFKLSIDIMMPWPVFLPKPLKLTVDPGMSSAGGFTLDGKLKLPMKLVETERFTLKPFFFVGAGVKPDGFSDVNAGGAANVHLKLFDLGRTGVSVGVEADGGAKYFHDLNEGKGKFKGILEGGVILRGEF